MTYQAQPTRTSCGPTCVAMLAGVPVAEVLARLKDARRPGTRVRGHSTSVADLARLLALYNLTMDWRRLPGVPDSGSAILRISKPGRQNWHWALWHEGRVFDPSKPARQAEADLPQLTSYYAVTLGR